jgi:TonB family protein
MDKGELRGAVPALTKVRRMLDQAKAAGPLDSTLVDLDVLVGGFLELARSVADLAAAEAAARSAAAAPAAAPPPPAAAPAAPTIAPTAAAMARGETAINRSTRVYTTNDADVTAPVTIRQVVPTIPYSVARTMIGQGPGVLEVVINEKGEVESAVMREPVNPIFDAAVLSAARTWRYRPAVKDGQAVKYTKRIGVTAAGVAR